MAKEAREIRRQSSPELSEEEQASPDSGKPIPKRRNTNDWKRMEETIEELETEVRHFDIEIERLKTERKERSAALQRKIIRAIPDAKCPRRGERLIYYFRANGSESSSCRCG